MIIVRVRVLSGITSFPELAIGDVRDLLALILVLETSTLVDKYQVYDTAGQVTSLYKSYGFGTCDKFSSGAFPPINN